MQERLYEVPSIRYEVGSEVKVLKYYRNRVEIGLK